MGIERYQNVIIGTGEAGKLLAWTLGKEGQRTMAVERGLVGGACPNVACLPSKNVIFSARFAALCGRAAEFGVRLEGMSIDMAGVTRRKRKMVEGLHQVHMDNFAASGAELVMGKARFVGPKSFCMALADGGERMVEGERVFLNLGSRAAIPSVPGLAEAGPMTHVDALELERVPGHLVVLGGGYVGVEFAQAMRRFGSRVTVIQAGKQLLMQEDPDVAEAVTQLLRDEGIEVLTEARVMTVAGRSGERVTLGVKLASGNVTIEGTDLLVAAGRTPNTDRIELEKGGVAVDARGYIRVDEKLRTSAAEVWAMGDCAGSPQFTHASLDDFRVVRDTLVGKEHTTKDRLIPYCLFTDPEVAHVGLNETEARAQGKEYRVAKIPMAKVLRARTLDTTRGFAKALVGSDDQIMGFTAFGPEASEMMVAVQVAMVGRVPYWALADVIFTHPTMAEGVGSLFGQLAAQSKAVH